MADIRTKLGYSTPTPNRPATPGSTAEGYAARKDQEAKNLAASGDTRGAMEAAQARNQFMSDNGQAYKAPNQTGTALTSTPLDVPKTSTMNITPTPGGALGMDKTQTGQITASTPTPQEALKQTTAPTVDQLPTGQSGMTQPQVAAPGQLTPSQQTQPEQPVSPAPTTMQGQTAQAGANMIEAAGNYLSYGQKAAKDTYDAAENARRLDYISALGSTNAGEMAKSFGVSLEDMSLPQLEQLAVSNGLAPDQKTIQRIQDEGAAAINSLKMERGDQEAVIKFAQDQLARSLGRAVTDTEKFNAVQDIKLRSAMAVFGGGSSDLGSNMAVLKQAEEGQQRLNDLASEYAGRVDINARQMQAVIREYGDKERAVTNQVTDAIQSKYAEVQNTMKELRKQGVTNMKDLEKALTPLMKEYVTFYSEATKWQAEQQMTLLKEANAEAERVFRRGLDLDKQLTEQTGKVVVNGEVLTDDNGNEIPTIDGLYKMSQVDAQRSELEGIVYMNGEPVVRNGQYVPTADIMKFDTQEARLNRQLDQDQAQFEQRLGFDISKEDFNQMMEQARFTQDVDEFNKTFGLTLDKFAFDQLRDSADRAFNMAKEGISFTGNVDLNQRTPSFNPKNSVYGIVPTQGGISVNAPVQAKAGGKEELVSGRRQCGEYVNDVLGIPGFFTNMFSEKKKKVSMDNPPKPGSAFLLNIAPPYGHVGIVEKVNPDGTLTISESNYDGNESFRRRDVSVEGLMKEGLVGFTGGASESMQKTGTTAKGKQLGETQVKMLSDAQFLPDVMNSLEDIFTNGKVWTGPVESIGAAINPLTGFGNYDENRKIAEAEIRRATQLVGSYMEGGVLRKEDEEKYAKMLPQLTDSKEVALAKLRGIKETLEQKRRGYIKDFGDAGYDTSSFQTSLNNTQGGAITNAAMKSFYNTLKLP